MLFSITGLGIAALAPFMVVSQELTTYSVTISGSLHTIVLPSPKVFATTTVYVTPPAFTVTSTVAESIETRTFTVTGPADELSTPPSLPSAVGYVSAISGVPGPYVPVVVNGFSTSIQIPATISVPPEPVNVVAPTSAGLASEAPISAMGNSVATESAAIQESIVASNVAGSAASQTAAASSNVGSQSNSASITVPPVTHTPTSAASVAASSQISKEASAKSNSVSSDTGSATTVASSTLSAASTAVTGAALSATSTKSIITATLSSLSTESPSVEASSAASTSNPNVGGSGSTPSSTTLSSAPNASSSAPKSPPSSSSTSAPTSGGPGSHERYNVGMIIFIGLITAALLT